MVQFVFLLVLCFKCQRLPFVFSVIHLVVNYEPILTLDLNLVILFTKSVFYSVISQGINAGDVKKLQDAGIYTCNGLMMHTKKV